ncbi:MAG: glycosyltransferase [Prevotella sp.]
MKILHFNPFDSKTHIGQSISTYISMLHDNMGKEVDMEIVTSLKELKRSIHNQPPELIHLYGAWNWKNGLATFFAAKGNIRYVYTPYGQLDPWILNQHYIKHKLPRIILYQKRMMRQAYVVIALGNIEKEKLQELGWNARIEVIYNPYVTSSITHEEVCEKLEKVYQKVLNSHVRQIMKENTKQALSILIKASQIDDIHWISEQERSVVQETSDNEWKKIAVYAIQEKITDLIEAGCGMLRVTPPEIDTNDLLCYPVEVASKKSEKVKHPPIPFKKDADNQTVSACFKAVLVLVKDRQLTLRHLIHFSYLLRYSAMEEDKFLQELQEQKETKRFQGLMSALAEYTSLETGFMPIPGKYNGFTKKIQFLIN